MQLVVARIGRAHGVRGEVTVEVRTDNPDQRFKVGASFRTEPENLGPLRLVSLRNHNGTLLMSFDGYHDRNSVEALRNVLLIADVELPITDTASDEFHISQIVGCRVIDESNNEVGIVKDVLQLPSQDTLVINRNGAEILIPFVGKHVPAVDVNKKEIRVMNLEGLL